MKLLVSSLALVLLTILPAPALGGEAAGDGSAGGFTARGLLVRAAVGISMCTGPESGDPDAEDVYLCDSFDDQTLGPAFGGALGWRFGPYVAAEVGFTFTSLGVERREQKGVATSRLGRWFAPRIGARAYPLGAAHRVEPVVSLHLGYVRLEGEPDLDYSCDVCPSILVATDTAWLHGVLLDFGIGLEVHVADAVAIDLEWTAFGNFWVERCPGRGYCEPFEGDFDDWFFNLDLGVSVVFG